MTGIHSACLKPQIKNIYTPILRTFLGITILHFNVLYAGETKKTSPQRVSEDFVLDIKKAGSTTVPANTVVTLSVVQEEEPNSTLTDGKQEIEKENPKESLNRVQDVVKVLLSNETDEDVKYEMKSLWRELEEKILSDNLSIPQVIDLLRNEVTEKAVIPYRRRAVIYIMRELLKDYSFPDNLQVSQIIDSLKEVISIKLINAYVRGVAIHIMGELLIQYPLPEPEISQALNQIKEHLFHENIYVRKTASQITEKLLKTDKISKIKKQETILWIADHLNDGNDKIKALALQILNNLVKLNIISDPDDKKKIILKLRKKLTNPNNKEAQKAAVAHLISLIDHKNNLLDSDDRKGIASELVELLTDPNWAIQTTTKEKAITNLYTLLNQQDTLLNSDDKKKIALILPQWLNDEKKKIQYTALKLSEILLNQITLPHPNQIILSNSEGIEITSIMELIHAITMLIFDDKQTIMQVAGRMIESFWTNDDFPLPEKSKIIQLIAEELPNASLGRIVAINVLQTAKQAGLPFDFDVIDKITETMSDPGPLSKAAESLVREALKDTTFSDNIETNDQKKLIIYLKMEQLLAERNPPAQEDSDQNTTCQNSMLASAKR